MVAQLQREPTGEFDAAIGDPEQNERPAMAVTFGNGIGEARKGGSNLVGADRLLFGHEEALWLAVESG